MCDEGQKSVKGHDDAHGGKLEEVGMQKANKWLSRKALRKGISAATPRAGKSTARRAL